MSQNKITDEEEVVIVAKPQSTKKASKSDTHPLLTLKNIPILLSSISLLFVLVAMFVALCGGHGGYIVLAAIATVINISALVIAVVNFFLQKKVKLEPLHIVIAFSILANIIVLF